MTVIPRYWPGALPAYMILFFPLSYVVRIEPFQSLTPSSLATIILFSGIIFIILATSISNKENLELTSNLLPFYIYLFYLTGILLVPSFLSLDPAYTSSRAIFSVVTFGLTLTVFYIIQYFYIQEINWQIFFEISSMILLVCIIIGQILIPDWSSGAGGIRLSGGTNPNTIGFYATFILIQTHINALLRNKWSGLQKTLWLTSAIVIIWTFSRSSLLTVFVIYFVYLSYFFLGRLIRYLRYGFNPRLAIMSFIKLVGLSLIIYLVITAIINSDYYVYIETRFSDTDNVVSRTSAWTILLDSFSENPLFGGLGWWEATRILDLYSLDGIASSPHNLFVRLLSEVGLIGTVAVLALPMGISIRLILNYKNVKLNFNNPIATYLFAVIVGIFLGQFFEDRYLVGVFDIGNNIIIWFLSLSLIVYHISNGMGNFTSMRVKKSV